jgi:predicted dehydrogenase
VVSKRNVDFPVIFHDLAAALEAELPEYVVIANETNQHQKTLSTLAKHAYKGMVLIEKPLFNHFVELPPHSFKKVFVAYNLRFHPAIQRLKKLLEHERVLSALVYVGQYLPEWRPNSDYRACYSASTEQGGGVLRDLSHELDYLIWMLGKWESVTAIGGHFSSLEITSDDIYAVTMTTSSCPIVNLQMNYLDRAGRRFILINTANHTIEVDLVKGIVTVDRDSETFITERDSTYRAMHEAIISGNEKDICTLDEGSEIMRLIEAVEHSAKKEIWVKR